jgi:8-oxo-dGTP pyrophosphatase MutT (NUDIX family)
MPRDPIPTWYFVVIAVCDAAPDGGRYLLVHERKHGQLWYLPGGRVEPGEALEEAAIRETLEETGIPVRLDGVIRVEHTQVVGEARVRVLYAASPLDDTPPKSTADEHTLEARWVTVEEMTHLPLRGFDVVQTLTYLARGGAIYPLHIITYEGAPFDDA